MADLCDEYGNPVRRTDGHGNPIRSDEYGSYQTGAMGTKGATGTGVQPGVTDVGIGGGHQQHERHGAGVVAGVLHRSGSSSSSSSEDDGHGGRRKKGMKEKIKEKLPGGHKHELGQTAGYGTEYTAGSGTGHVVHEPEKKGIMEKIKEKLPGHHQDKEQTQY